MHAFAHRSDHNLKLTHPIQAQLLSKGVESRSICNILAPFIYSLKKKVLGLCCLA